MGFHTHMLMGKKPLNLFISEDTIKRLKHLAVHRNTTISSLIEEWTNKQFKKGKEIGDLFSDFARWEKIKGGLNDNKQREKSHNQVNTRNNQVMLCIKRT